MKAAVITAPDQAPRCDTFPDPEHQPGREPLHLVAAGLSQAVRGMAAGLHYGSSNRYPLVPGADAVARTSDGRLVYTAFAREPWGTMAEQMITPFDVELPP